MLSALIVAATAVVLVRAQCPCYPYQGDTTYMICDDPSLTTIPDCVASDVPILSIQTPSIPLIPSTISRFTNLERINIEFFDNPIMTKNFLQGKTKLNHFQFYYTSMTSVDKEWFSYAPSLRSVILSHNQISRLAADTFSSLAQLQVVFLDNNQLTTLSPTLFVGTSLNTLNLDGNPWYCDCQLANFMQWTTDNAVTVEGQAYCANPPELTGTNLFGLTPDIVCKK